MRKIGWAATAALAPVPAMALAADDKSGESASSMSSVTYAFHYATSQVAHHSHMGLGIVAILIILAIGAALIALHFLPGIIALRRHHPNALPIWLINIFFGWTLIGWIIALVWALN